MRRRLRHECQGNDHLLSLGVDAEDIGGVIHTPSAISYHPPEVIRVCAAQRTAARPHATRHLPFPCPWSCTFSDFRSIVAFDFQYFFISWFDFQYLSIYVVISTSRSHTNCSCFVSFVAQSSGRHLHHYCTLTQHSGPREGRAHAHIQPERPWAEQQR